MKKQYTTNYFNAFIQVAEDCPAKSAEIPPIKEPKSSARVEYETLINSPYRYTSDDVIYEMKGKPKGVAERCFFQKGSLVFELRH